MHIADQVAAALIAQGFTLHGTEYRKMVDGMADAGQFSNGRRLVTLRIDASGRWFERVGGWGEVLRDVDLRNFSNANDAISEVLA